MEKGMAIAVTPDLRQKAIERFGERADGLLSVLVEELGPAAAKILLGWLLTKVPHDPMVEHSLLDKKSILSFVAGVIKSHKEDLKNYVANETDVLIDVILGLLDSAAGSEGTDPETFTTPKRGKK